MATDIAFALGVLALVGRRVPVALSIFLATLAVADDLGAVVTIALFYSEGVHALPLAVAGAMLGLALVVNWSGIRHPFVYTLVGTVAWYAMLQSGVHATVAGVLMAMTIPARTRMDTGAFARNVRRLLDRYEQAAESGSEAFPTHDQNNAVQTLEIACEFAQTPLQRFERRLHLWIVFAVMPLFAIANAGVVLPSNIAAAAGNPVALGVVVGLCLGKSFGIVGICRLAVWLRLAELPEGVTWNQIYGVAWLGGIGFTMSLFVTALAFGTTALADTAKLGVLTASLLSGIVGYLILRRAVGRANAVEAGG